jgi:hypothetical protein
MATDRLCKLRKDMFFFSIRWVLILLVLHLSVAVMAQKPSLRAITQLNNQSVEEWPRLPMPWADFDWKKRFLDFDSFIFDWGKQSTFPTIKLDTTHYNMESNTVYIPAYYGDERINHDGWQDGLTFISVVAGSTLCGRNKDSVVVGDEAYNYVDMLRTFKHDYGKRKIVYSFAMPTHNRNHTDWWYDAGPSILYYMVGDLYPDEPGMNERLREIADGFYEMVYNLGGADANFWYQAYNFDTDKPVNSVTWNGKTVAWKCPEAGVVAAVIEYWAYKKFGDEKYLRAAKWCMDYYDKIDKNPYYEMSISFGPYIAAMMNAEFGTQYDPDRYINWLIKGSDVRTGYGTAEGNWNGYDVYGLGGSRTDGGGAGYVFVLETFANGFLAPAAKYDPRLAKTVGKWLLNASNAARFFYADQMPQENQFYGSKYVDAPENVIPYEGLRYSEAGQSPRATGDPVAYNKHWANYGPTFDVGRSCTNLSIYGGAWTGFFGAILKNTNVSRILQIDLNKLDFFTTHKFYPAYLYYNPYTVKKTVALPLNGSSDIFNVLTGKYIARNVSKEISFDIGPDDVVSLVIAPAKSKLTYDGKKTLINGTPVVYDPALKE